MLLLHAFHCLMPVARLGHDFDVAPILQVHANPLAHHRVIVSHYNPQRSIHAVFPFSSFTCTIISVPLPVADLIAKTPPKASVRSRIFIMPNPPSRFAIRGFCASAKPIPSSITFNVANFASTFRSEEHTSELQS